MSTEYFLACKDMDDYVNIGKMNNIDGFELVSFLRSYNGLPINIMDDNQFLDFCNNELKRDVLKDPELRKIWLGEE